MVCCENQGVMTESHAVLGISTILLKTAALSCFFLFLLIPLSVFLFLLYYIYFNSLHSQDSYLDYIEVSMSDSKDENLAEELFLKLSDPKFVQQQVQNVIDLDWQLGIPVMQADQDGIYEIKPDGTKIYQKK